MSEQDNRPEMKIAPPNEDVLKAIFDERSTHCLVDGTIRISDQQFNGNITFAGTEEECEEEQKSRAGRMVIVHKGFESVSYFYEIDEFRGLLEGAGLKP